MTAPAAPPFTPPPRRHARMLPYAAWQLRDYAINIAVISIVLFGLIGTVEVMQLELMASAAGANKFLVANMASMRVQSFKRLLDIYTTVGPIVALSGIVANDRAMGYVRFLFAKPLNPLRFYLQSFAVRMVGYFGVGAVLFISYRHFEPAADISRVALGLLLGFIVYGGMLFLVSVFTKYDGLVTIAFLLVAAVVWGKWEAATNLKRFIPYVFPPLGKFSDVNSWVSGVNPIDSRGVPFFPTKWVVWTMCYAVACVVLGLVALRKRPLAKA